MTNFIIELACLYHEIRDKILFVSKLIRLIKILVAIQIIYKPLTIN